MNDLHALSCFSVSFALMEWVITGVHETAGHVLSSRILRESSLSAARPSVFSSAAGKTLRSPPKGCEYILWRKYYGSAVNGAHWSSYRNVCNPVKKPLFMWSSVILHRDWTIGGRSSTRGLACGEWYPSCRSANFYAFLCRTFTC